MYCITCTVLMQGVYIYSAYARRIHTSVLVMIIMIMMAIVLLLLPIMMIRAVGKVMGNYYITIFTIDYNV